MMKLVSLEKKNGKDYWESLLQNAEKIRSCDTREELEEILNTGRKETIRLSVEKAVKELSGYLPAFFGAGLTKKELVDASVTSILKSRKRISAGM